MYVHDEIDLQGGPHRRPSVMARLTKLCLIMVTLLVLIGLFLPWVQTSGRGNNSKNRCAMNLHFVGYGIKEYVASHNQFPPGTIPNPDLPLDRRLGWGIAILAYTDEIARLKLADEIDRLAWDDPSFADLTDHPPDDMYCHASKTRASYVAIAGLGIDAPSLPTNHPRAGIFGDDRKVTPADIKDGTSHTMMLVESASLPGPWFAGGRANVQGLNNLSQPYIGSNRQFGGLHSGGANVLFADGSVRFVTESIDPKVLEAMSTMAGGEKVSAPWDD